MTIIEQFINQREIIRNYLLHQTGGDNCLTEDLIQDMFLKINDIADKGKYVEEGKFIYWARTIARNMLVDYYRRSKVKLPVSNEESKFTNDLWDIFGEIEDEEYEDTFVTPEMSARLKEAISELPVAQQDLIHMRYYRNMSYKEIVLETGERQENLLPRMHYAIKKLRLRLKDGNE